MNKELLLQLRLEDLRGDARDLAELIGLDNYLKLVEVYGGTGRLYIPQPDILIIPVRDELIRREYDGDNLYALCSKWDLSETTVRKIVQSKAEELRRKPMDGQCTLFDAG